MSDNKKDIERLLKENLPRTEPRDKPARRSPARQRAWEEIRKELEEATLELEALTGSQESLPVWPGLLEPLVLAAAFLLHGKGEVESIAENVCQLAPDPPNRGAIRFAVERLVRRGLLSETDRCFSITAEGERELAKARANAKRWIDALADWPGPL